MLISRGNVGLFYGFPRLIGAFYDFIDLLKSSALPYRELVQIHQIGYPIQDKEETKI